MFPNSYKTFKYNNEYVKQNVSTEENIIKPNQY